MPGNNCAAFSVSWVMTRLQIGICRHMLCHIVCPVPGSVHKVSQTPTEDIPTDMKFCLVRETCHDETKMSVGAERVRL